MIDSAAAQRHVARPKSAPTHAPACVAPHNHLHRAHSPARADEKYIVVLCCDSVNRMESHFPVCSGQNIRQPQVKTQHNHDATATRTRKTHVHATNGSHVASKKTKSANHNNNAGARRLLQSRIPIVYCIYFLSFFRKFRAKNQHIEVEQNSNEESVSTDVSGKHK